jgi:hypothetical protein
MPIYFVSNAGSNSNAGTSEGAPFLTHAHANSVAVSGDTINFLFSSTFPETVTYTGLAGITLQSYGGTGQAKLQPTPSATNQVITFQDCSGVTLQNLDISSPALISPSTTFGQRVVEFLLSTGAEQSNFLVNNCTIHDALGGVLLGNTHTSQATVVCNNFQFTNNTCFNLMCRGAFECSSSNSATSTTYMYTNGNVSNNVIHDVTGVSQTNTNGILLQACSGWTVSGNQITNIGTGTDATGGPTGIQFGQCSNCTATGNTINGVHTAGSFDGDGLDFDLLTVGCTFNGNFIENCDGAGILFFSNAASGTPNVACNNIVVNCGNKNGYTPLSMRNTFGAQIFNNTVLQLTSTSPALSSDATADTANYKVYNNIFQNPAGDPCVVLPTAATGFDLQGNAYLSGTGFSATYNGTNYTTLAAWRTATGLETSPHGFSLTATPCIAPSPVPTITLATLRLAYDYSLVAGSPLLGGGLNLTSLFGITLPSTDILGNAISPTNLSVGAINVVKPPAYVWEFIQKATAQPASATSSIEAAFPNPVTAGNLIAAVVTSEASITPNFTDTASDSYATAVQEDNISVLGYTKATASGSLTVTASIGSSTPLSLAIGEWKPPLGSIFSLGNIENGNVNGSTAVSIGPVTTTLPSAVILGVNLGGNNPTITPGSGMTLRANQPGAGLSPGVFIQDNLAASSSPVSLAATLSSSTNWFAVAAAFPSPLPPYSIIGPTSGAVGVAAQFFLVPTGTPAATDTITLATTGSGTFSSTSLSVTESPADIAFTYTPTEPGPVTLTLTSANSLTVGGSPYPFAAFVDFAMTGPTSGLMGQPSTITLTPVAATTDTITFASTVAGTFSPTSLTFSNSSAAQSVTFTPSAAGSGTITATSTDSAPITGSPLSFAVASITVSPMITKWGGLQILTNASSGEVNGYFPIAAVTAVNANPNLFMNGHAVALNGPVWADIGQSNAPDGALAMWYAQCGSVTGITAEAGGENYTSASAAWTSGSGGGTSLELGTPVLGSGVTSYTINSPGSGMTNGNTNFTVPGGTFTQAATALVTVAGGAVTAVVPACGSWVGMGSGYTGTSFSFTFGNATITANISGYVAAVPVTSSSDDFTSIPTVTITGNGTGATMTAIMSGPPAGAAMTMSLAAGAISTSSGTSLAFPLGSIPNYAGQLEPYFANVTPTIPYGGELTPQMFPAGAGPLFLAKNKLLAGQGWVGGGSLDANGFPISGTPGATVSNTFYIQNNIYMCPSVGTWTIIADDTEAGNSGFTPMAILSNVGAVIGTPHRVVSGSLVTITMTIELPTNPTTNNLGLLFVVTWPTSGTWNLSNIRILAPGNTDTFNTNPLDMDDIAVAALTGPTGTTPGVLRLMDCIFGYSGASNYIIPADYPYPSPYVGACFQQFQTNTVISLTNARALNINPSNTSFSWSSPLMYVWNDEVVGGTDSSFDNNKYIDMRLGPNGVNDNGAINTGVGAGAFSAIEFTTASPHGLKTLQIVSITIGAGTVLPFSVSGNVDIGVNGATINVFVTGPNTFFMYYDIGGSGNTIQTVNSFSEFALTGSFVTLPLPYGGAAPFEFAASAIARFPGTIFHCNLSCPGSTAFHQFQAQRIYPYLANTDNPIIVEWYDEPWNDASAGVGQAQGRAKWPQYVASGTSCFNGYFTANGSALPGAGTAVATAFSTAAAYKTFSEELISLGLAPSRLLGCLYNSQPGSINGVAAGYLDAINDFSLPGSAASGMPGAIVQANYMSFPFGETIGTALSPAGTSGGNWPVWLINDLFRWYINYSTYYQGLYEQTNALILATVPGMTQGFYEGGMTTPVPSYVLGAGYLAYDCMNHESFADAYQGFFVSSQLGNPTIPGSGGKFGSIYCLWYQTGGNPGDPLWCIDEGPNMPVGLGTSNQFFTPQGGPAGSTGLQPQGFAATNQSPGRLALRNWNAAMPAAVGYTLSGPTSGFVGDPYTYTLTPAAATTNTLTLSDSSGGGAFSPTSLTFTRSSAPQTFTYTPGLTGTKSLSVTSSTGETVTGSPVSFVVTSVGYAVTGPTTGYMGNPVTYTVTPAGTTTDTITFSDASGGGTFSPSSLTFSNSSAAQTFLYTPGSTGTKTITVASADGGTISGSPASLSVSSVNYRLGGPTAGFVGYALGYTLTPFGVMTDVITLSDGGGGGTFYPPTLVISSSSAVQSVAYVPGSNGTKTLTFTSADGGTISGSPVTLSVSTAPPKPAAKWFSGLRNPRSARRY